MSQDQRPIKDQIVSTYIAEDVKAELVKLAERNYRSLSQELRVAIDKHLASELAKRQTA